MSSDLAASIAQAGKGGGATMRTARVTALDYATITLDVGGGELVAAPYLDSYVPILGDYVQVLQAGAVSLILGRVSGSPADNLLLNPGFEADPPGTDTTTGITGWSKYLDPGSPADADVLVDTVSGWGSADGTQWLELNYNGAGAYVVVSVLSEAIPVNPDERFTAAARATMHTEDETGSNATLYLTWYADVGDTYPTTVAADTEIQTAEFPIGGIPGWVLLRQLTGSGYPVPAGARAMRVRLKTLMRVDGSAFWDSVVARKI